MDWRWPAGLQPQSSPSWPLFSEKRASRTLSRSNPQSTLETGTAELVPTCQAMLSGARRTPGYSCHTRSFQRPQLRSHRLGLGRRMASSNSIPEGYATLSVIEHGAPNYNAWLGKRLRAHLGKRVLEVGAGIGTITREILPDRELVIALEAEELYAGHLDKAFRGNPRVRTLHSRVEETNWAQLATERLDSVLLSNVLEHIEDDAAAVRDFRRALPPGGNIVILVPALPFLFGTLDTAVGHHRRYMPASLHRVIE